MQVESPLFELTAILTILATAAGTGFVILKANNKAARVGAITLLVVVSASVLALDLRRPHAPATIQDNSPRYLYQADWSRGMDGWTGVSDWQANQGLMQNDGNTPLSGTQADFMILAPQSFSEQPNYSVSADIRIDGVASTQFGCNIGLLLHTDGSGAGYEAGVNGVDSSVYPNSSAYIVATEFTGQTQSQPYLAPKTPFTPDSGWHDYVFTFSGPNLSLVVDGKLLVQAQDSTYPAGAQVGLADYRCAASVKDLTVSAA